MDFWPHFTVTHAAISAVTRMTIQTKLYEYIPSTTSRQSRAGVPHINDVKIFTFQSFGDFRIVNKGL